MVFCVFVRDVCKSKIKATHRHTSSSWRTSDVFTSEGLSVLDDLCLGKNLSRFKGTGEMFYKKNATGPALVCTWHHLTLYSAQLQLDSISPRTVIPLFPSPWAVGENSGGLSDVKTEVSAHTFARTCCDRTEQTRDSRHQPDFPSTGRAFDQGRLEKVWTDDF